MRLPYNLSKWLPPPPHPASKICLPNLLCFGDFEKDMYNHYGHEIGHYHSVGSLRGGYYHNALRPRDVEQRFDICMISEWEEGLQENVIFKEIREGVEILENYVSRYTKIRDVKVCIATRAADNRERDHFLEIFGEQVTIIRNNRETMSTYLAIDQSNVSITAYSTVGVEAFGWGKKVLFCNFTGHDNYSLPVPDVCSIDKPDFGSFCMKLDFLLSMDESRFNAVTHKSSKYLMNYDTKMPPHLYMQRIIHDEIET